MHELGIVFHVLDSLEEVAKDNNLTKIQNVTLEIGEVSAVIPHYLSDCWNWSVKKRPLFHDCTLCIETLPAVTWCDDCKKEYETVTYGRICPYCKSERTWLLKGNEMNIKDITAI